MKDIETIDSLNSWMFNHSLRRYQYLLATKQYFLLDYKGIHFSIFSCTFRKGNNNLYFLSEDDTSVNVLLSKGVGTGYELHKELVRSNDYPYNEYPSLENVVLIQGHRNFAHFMWNELDGLIRLSQISSSLFTVKQKFNTIFDLSILPNIKLITTPLKDESTLAVGSQIVSDDVRICILTNLRPITMNGEAVLNLIGHNPVVLLGVRGQRSRELCNEVELYVGLIEKLYDRCKDIYFLLDGLSLDRSFDGKANSAFLSENGILESISKILTNSPSPNVYCLHGISYDDYLHIAKNVSYCVTHAGTMHHKICWLYTSIPSTLITNHPRPHLAAAWHSKQSTHPLNIDCLPAKLIFYENPFSKNVRNTREERYCILNISECIDFCFDVITRNVLIC